MKRFKGWDPTLQAIIMAVCFLGIMATMNCTAMTSLVTPAPLSPISIAKQQSTTWMNAYTTVQKNPASNVAQKATAAQALPLIQAYNLKIHNGTVPTADEGTAINNLINKMKEQGGVK